MANIFDEVAASQGIASPVKKNIFDEIASQEAPKNIFDQVAQDSEDVILANKSNSAPVIRNVFDEIKNTEIANAERDPNSRLNKTKMAQARAGNPFATPDAALPKSVKEQRDASAVGNIITRPSWVPVAGKAVVKGLADTGAGIARLPAVAYDVQAIPENLLLKMMRRPQRQSPEWLLNNPVAKFMEDQSKKFTPEELKQDPWQYVQNGDYAGAGRNLMMQTIANAPQQAIIIGASMAGLAPVGLAMMGGSQAGSVISRERGKGNTDALNIATNAATQGTIEAAFESIGTMGLFKNTVKKITASFGKEAGVKVIASAVKSLGIQSFGEANEEFLTSYAQDFSDYIHGDSKSLDGAFGRAVNAGAVGGLSGGLISTPAAYAFARDSKRANVAFASGVKAVVEGAITSPELRGVVNTEATFLNRGVEPKTQEEALKIIKEVGNVDSFSPNFRSAIYEAKRSMAVRELEAYAKENNIPINLAREVFFGKAYKGKLEALDKQAISLVQQKKDISKSMADDLMSKFRSDVTPTFPPVEALYPNQEVTPAKVTEYETFKDQIRSLWTHRRLIASGVDPIDIIIASGVNGPRGQATNRVVEPTHIINRYKAVSDDIKIDTEIPEPMMVSENVSNPDYKPGRGQNPWLSETRPIDSLRSPYRGANFARLSGMKAEYNVGKEVKTVDFLGLPLYMREQLLNEQLPANDKETQMVLNKKLADLIDTNTLVVTTQGPGDSQKVSYFFPALLRSKGGTTTTNIEALATVMKQYSQTNPNFDLTKIPIIGLMYPGQEDRTPQVRQILLEEIQKAAVFTGEQQTGNEEVGLPEAPVVNPDVANVELNSEIASGLPSASEQEANLRNIMAQPKIDATIETQVPAISPLEKKVIEVMAKNGASAEEIKKEIIIDLKEESVANDKRLGKKYVEEQTKLSEKEDKAVARAKKLATPVIHKMVYDMPAADNLSGIDTTTIDAMEKGERTSTTRSFPLGDPGQIVQFKDKEGKLRPQKYMVVMVHKIGLALQKQVPVAPTPAGSSTLQSGVDYINEMDDTDFVNMLAQTEMWTPTAIQRMRGKEFADGNWTTVVTRVEDITPVDMVQANFEGASIGVNLEEFKKYMNEKYAAHPSHSVEGVSKPEFPVYRRTTPTAEIRPTSIPERKVARAKVNLTEALEVIHDLGRDKKSYRYMLLDLIKIKFENGTLAKMKIGSDKVIPVAGLVRRAGRGTIYVQQALLDQFVKDYLKGKIAPLTKEFKDMTIPRGMTEQQIRDFVIWHELAHAIEGLDGSAADEIMVNIIALTMIGRGDLAQELYASLPESMVVAPATPYKIDINRKEANIIKRDRENFGDMKYNINWRAISPDEVKRSVDFALRYENNDMYSEQVQIDDPTFGIKTVVDKSKIKDDLLTLDKRMMGGKRIKKSRIPKSLNVKVDTSLYGNDPAEIAGRIVELRKETTSKAYDTSYGSIAIFQEMMSKLKLWKLDAETLSILGPLGQTRSYLHLINDLVKIKDKDKPWKNVLQQFHDALAYNHMVYLAERTSLLDSIIPLEQRPLVGNDSIYQGEIKEPPMQVKVDGGISVKTPAEMRAFVDKLTTGPDLAVREAVARFRRFNEFVTNAPEKKVSIDDVIAKISQDEEAIRSLNVEGTDALEGAVDTFMGDLKDFDETFSFSSLTPVKDSDPVAIKMLKGTLGVFGLYKGQKGQWATIEKMSAEYNKNLEPLRWAVIDGAIKTKNLFKYSRGMGGECESLITTILADFLKVKYPDIGLTDKVKLMYAYDTLMFCAYADVGAIKGNNTSAWTTYTGLRHKMTPKNLEAFLDVYPKVINALHELDPTIPAIDALELAAIAKSGERPELAFWNRLPKELQQVVLYAKNEMEAPVFYKKLMAGHFDRVDVVKHKLTGFFHGYFIHPDQKGYLKSGLSNPADPPKDHETPEEFIYETSATEGIEPVPYLSKSMNDYVSKGVISISQTNLLESLKFMPAPLTDLAGDLTIVEYQNRWRTRPNNPKLAAIWDDCVNPGTKEIKVEKFLDRLGYKPMKNAPGLVDWHQAAFSDPWVHKSVFDHLDSMFTKANTPTAIKGWLRLSGYVQRIILLSKYSMYLDNVYTMIIYTKPSEKLSSLQLGQIPRFSAAPRSHIEDLDKLVNDGEMDYRILDLMRKNNVVMLNPDQMMQNLLDANAYKDPNMQDFAEKFKEFLVAQGGLERWMYQRALPLITYRAYANLLQAMLKKYPKQTEDEVASMVAQFINNISYSFDGDMVYGPLRDPIKAVLFGADPAFGLIRTITGAAYPMWKKHHKYRPIVGGDERNEVLRHIGNGFANIMLHGTTPPEEMERLHKLYLSHLPKALLHNYLFQVFFGLLCLLMYNAVNEKKRTWDTMFPKWNSFNRTLYIASMFDDDNGRPVQFSANMYRETGDIIQMLSDPGAYMGGKARVGLSMAAQLLMNRDRRDFKIIHPGATPIENAVNLTKFFSSGAKPTFVRTDKSLNVPGVVQSGVRALGGKLTAERDIGKMFTQKEQDAQRRDANRLDFLSQETRKKLADNNYSDEIFESMLSSGEITPSEYVTLLKAKMDPGWAYYKKHQGDAVKLMLKE